MSIRAAVPSDIERISEIASRSLLDGPYAGIIEDNPEVAKKFAAEVLQGGKILLAEEDGQVIGLLGFIVSNHHFSGQLYACELMWYVEAEHRNTGAALKLFWEAEKVAKEMGAKDFWVTAPNEQVGALYKRFGFKQTEVTYSKAL